VQGQQVVVGRGQLSDALWDGHRYALAVVGGATYVTHVSAGLQPEGDNLALAPYGAGGNPMLTLQADGLIATYLRRAFEPAYGGVYRAFLRTPQPISDRARPVPHCSPPTPAP